MIKQHRALQKGNARLRKVCPDEVTAAIRIIGRTTESLA